MVNQFQGHIATLSHRYREAIEYLNDSGLAIECLLIHSGQDTLYYADDQAVPFQAYGHFGHWLPINRPDQLLLITPDKKPVYFQVTPSDYWHDQSIKTDSWWSEEFEIQRYTEVCQVAQQLKDSKGMAYIGANPELANKLNIAEDLINPTKLLQILDYHRAYKNPYELEQIRAANKKALTGHDAARSCFKNGGSEFDIHMAFLQACKVLEYECPYPNIVALDEKAAVLHYQYKRHHPEENNGKKGQVLLIDAGCRVNNYCSDITRTWTKPDIHPVFQSLVGRMEEIELELVSIVKPGLDYLDLHKKAMNLIGSALIEHGVINCTHEQAAELSLPGVFMPHGVGHLLGIQVHDVGGHLNNSGDSERPPPGEYPFLRNTRAMEENMVFTVEPGLYFIPMLLDEKRSSEEGKCLNWDLIDELIPLGGIRIEDNVQVTADGVFNITRD